MRYRGRPVRGVISHAQDLLAAVGGLTVQRLSLKVPVYDPRIHYHQVRDSWFGLRTPDGK